MNRLIEENYVEEIDYGTNFAYVLNSNDLFLPTEYKVLQSQKENEFVKCMKTLYNGKIQLFYLVEKGIPFDTLIPKLDSEGFLTITSNIFMSIIDVNNNGFLSCENIDISFDHIFIDRDTLKARLVYVPAKNRLYSDVSEFENEFRTSLVKMLLNYTNINSDKSRFLVSDLQNGTMSIESIYSKLKGNKAAVDTSEKKNNHYLSIVTMNESPRVEFKVNKHEYVIGKKASVVDGVVDFNKLISRVHCKIITKNYVYYIEDLQSANGTYVNKVRIPPHSPVKISNGDIVRLANSDFQVVIS